MKPLESFLRTFVELHPEDAARAFETLGLKDGERLFKSLPTRIAVELLERIRPQMAAALLEVLAIDKAREVLSAMSPRSASAVCHQMEESKREEILSEMPSNVSSSIKELNRYAADTAGGIMEPRVASLSIDLTAQQAISAVRKTPRQVLHYLYVSDREGKLIGVLTMRDLLLASPKDPIEKYVRREIACVQDTMPREEAVDMIAERGFLALPVVDYEGRLVGVIKHDDAAHARELEVFEDLQKIVGAGADERALSPVSKVVKSRLPWLYVNLATAFLAAAVIGLFEGIIAQVAALAVLLPVVAGQGGNTGSQSLAIVMRGLALREVIPGVKRRLILKEFMGGLINGVAVAIGTSVCVLIWRMMAGDTMQAGIGLSLVIGLAMVVNMAAAAFSGAIIPLLLRALGRDPAQSASIFLTTVTDVVGFAAFLGFASLFMPMIT